MIIAEGFLITVVIFLISHLTVDKDFPEPIKVGSWVVFGLLGLIYTIFGVLF